MMNESNAARGVRGENARPIEQEPPSEGDAERAKYDVGGLAPPSLEPGHLPWGYGDNRVTAMPRSPEALYMYWEITDEAIHAARERLGPDGKDAWCNLRIYDTTGRDFDGTNANHYFDLRIERGDREYFLGGQRPASSIHVEIGMKSAEGFFQRIARSGRVDFPRKSPSPNSALEWMTVTADRVHPAARPYESRFAGPEPPMPSASHGGPGAGAGHGGGGHGGAHAPGAVESRSWAWQTPGTWVLDEWRVEWRVGWTAGAPHGTWSERWAGPIEGFAWTFGPFDPTRVEIHFDADGPVLVDRTGARFDAFASWRVTIRGFERAAERRVLGSWMVHWARLTPPQAQRWWTSVERLRTGAFRREKLTFGASEAFLAIEQGASELWRIGASERMWLGGSEWLALGGSETLFGGASGFFFAGASERAFGGASEWTYAGGSEAWSAFGGGSEAYFGASETFARGGE